MLNENSFTVEKISDSVYKINESVMVSCFLVIGERKALLMDCGMGLGGLRNIVEGITSLPVTLVASHAHVDHIGGGCEFGKMYMHKDDIPIASYSSSLKERKAYIKRSPALKKAGITFDLDTLPKKNKPNIYIPLTDGHIFDLGGVTVKAIHTPGHSKGSCIFRVLPDEVTLVGDNFIPYLHLGYPGASSLSEWVKGCERFIIECEGDNLQGSHSRRDVPWDGVFWQYEQAKKVLSENKSNKKEKKLISIEHPDNHILCLKYLQNKIY